MWQPTTWYPRSWSRQAATEESTPPDIATSTRAPIAPEASTAPRPCRKCPLSADLPPWSGHGVAVIEARFDDLTPGGASFRLAVPAGVVEARRPDEVVGCLEAARAAAARGLWVGGFVAYEAAPGLDPALVVRTREPGDPFEALPLAWFAIFERQEPATLAEPDEPGPGHPAWSPSASREEYGAAVGRIRELIAEGQTYQVNHTMRMRARIVGDERGLYRDVSLAQRGAYSAYLNLGRYRVLSASPELFFRIDRDRIATRPMKGTSPRGRFSEEDERAAGPPPIPSPCATAGGPRRARGSPPGPPGPGPGRGG